MRLGQHDARHDRLLGCSHFEQRKPTGPQKKKRPGHFGSACWRSLRAAPCGTRRSMETFATARCCCAITPPHNRSEPRVWLVLSEGVMTFIIHASKNGQSVATVRISPAVAVDKARVLESLGWQRHVTDSAGHQFDPSDFDRLSALADETA